MEWHKLPSPEELAGNDSLLQKTVLRLLFRYGSLHASMMSIMLRMETEPVLAAIRELRAGKRISIDRKQAALCAQTPEERIRYELA